MDDATRIDTPLAWPPGHFYSPIPDLSGIAAQRSRIFDALPDLPGIDLNEAGQLAFFDALSRHHDAGFFPETPRPDRRFHFQNDNFRHGEALILSALLRHLRPSRVIEVGSGYSSCAMLDTRDAMTGAPFDVTFIEPYPALLQSLIRPGDADRITVIDQPVQAVETAVFAQLQANDVLFVDLTHVLKTDSDVAHHLFRILPALAPGVFIHFHDVFYPFEYPEAWVMQSRAWNELYALRAFLMHNDRYQIALFASWLHQRYPDRMAAGMPLAMQGPGSSLWLRKLR